MNPGTKIGELMMRIRKIIREILPARLHYSDNVNHFELYQIKPTSEFRKYMYMGTDLLERMGWKVNKDRYTLVYTDKINEKTTPDDIFVRFNRDIPKNFRGRSASVSDILVICINGNKTTYYVDSFGFEKMSDDFWDN